MLQILLAFLAISIVSVTGYSLMEQLSLQQAMQDQRENMRRLDVAADAIQGRLVAVPGLDGVFAPAPETAGPWAHIPAGLGGVNRTVAGVPFLYCPIAAASNEGTSVSVTMPGGGAYSAVVRSDVVVGSDLAVDAEIASYKPVAFIVAAGRNADAPPSCDRITTRNGRPFVEGGLVKVVSRPEGALVGGTISRDVSDLFVSAAGGGDGRTASSPASLDEGLAHWIRFKPSSMTIHVAGTVSPSAARWLEFVSALRGSATRLAFDGGVILVPAAPGYDGGIFSPSSMSLNNTVITGGYVIVEQGDQLNVTGNVIVGASGAPAGVVVLQGGRLNLSDGALRAAGGLPAVVSVAGELAVQGSTLGAYGAPTTATLYMQTGGRLVARGSVIGDAGLRPLSQGIVSAGAWSISSDAGSMVAAAQGGSCWSGVDASDVTFAYSANGVGASSAVVDAPPPADPGDADQVAAYRVAQESRRRARETNHSNFQCT